MGADSPLSKVAHWGGSPPPPPLPQLLPRFHPAPSSASKHVGNINLSPAICLSWCWQRQHSLDISPRADSGSPSVDNGFQQIGQRSDLTRAWRPRPPPALAAAGCCLLGRTLAPRWPGGLSRRWSRLTSWPLSPCTAPRRLITRNAGRSGSAGIFPRRALRGCRFVYVHGAGTVFFFPAVSTAPKTVLAQSRRTLLNEAFVAPAHTGPLGSRLISPI